MTYTLQLLIPYTSIFNDSKSVVNNDSSCTSVVTAGVWKGKSCDFRGRKEGEGKKGEIYAGEGKKLC